MASTAKTKQPTRKRKVTKKRKATASKQTNARKRTRTKANDTDASLEKVRDILFGTQAKEADKRFDALEARLRKETLAIRRELNKRLDSLESHVKSTAEALASNSAEDARRTSELERLKQQIEKTTQSLDKKIRKTEQNNVESVRALRKRVVQQSKRLRELIRQVQDEVNEARGAAVDRLDADKVDRKTLADLFSQFSARLNNS